MVGFLPTVLNHAKGLEVGQRAVEQGHDHAIIERVALVALKYGVKSLPQVMNVDQSP